MIPTIFAHLVISLIVIYLLKFHFYRSNGFRLGPCLIESHVPTGKPLFILKIVLCAAAHPHDKTFTRYSGTSHGACAAITSGKIFADIAEPRRRSAHATMWRLLDRE